MIKVLVVDDESWNRELIKTFGEWQSYGMEIVGEAEGGMKPSALPGLLSRIL